MKKEKRKLSSSTITIGRIATALLVAGMIFFICLNTTESISSDSLTSEYHSTEYLPELKTQASKSPVKVKLQTVEREKVDERNTVLYDAEQTEQTHKKKDDSLSKEKTEPSVSSNTLAELEPVNIFAEDGTLIPWEPIIHEDMSEEELQIAEERLMQYEKQLMQYQSELENPATKTSKLLEGINLTRIGIVSDSQVAAVVKGFNSLPAKVQDTIIANGYRVEVTNEDIEKLITGGGTNSWFGATAGTPLFVSIISIHQTETEMTRTTIHELGHAYDNSIGLVSSTPEFITNYLTEGKTMYKTADVHDASEWFAECLVYYVLDPALLKQAAPKSYLYMDTLLKEG